MGGLGGKVAVIGTGTIKFGENFHQSLSDMIFEAVNLALADAKIEFRQLQAAWLGCYEPMLYGFEGNSGTVVSDPLNLFPIPVTRVAAYCARRASRPCVTPRWHSRRASTTWSSRPQGRQAAHGPNIRSAVLRTVAALRFRTCV